MINNQSKRQPEGKDVVSERNVRSKLLLMTCTDHLVDISAGHYNRAGFTKDSHSRASIVINGMDDSDELFESSVLVSNGSEQEDMSYYPLTSEDSDDELYHSVKSDTEDNYVS